MPSSHTASTFTSSGPHGDSANDATRAARAARSRAAKAAEGRTKGGMDLRGLKLTMRGSGVMRAPWQRISGTAHGPVVLIERLRAGQDGPAAVAADRLVRRVVV